MKKIFQILFFVIFVISASCTKENNQFGKGKVNVNKIGYRFNNVTTKGNKIVENVIKSSVLLDDNYILIGELIETNEDIIPNTKLTTYEDVTAVKVLTFYQQDSKTENRVQDLNMTNKTFELPPEGGCDVVFFGNVGSNSSTLSMNNNEDKATVTSVNSGTNLCYIIKSYGNSIPEVEDLSNMTPLFAQIGEIVIPELTMDNWSVEAINNLKITAGNQASSGSIIINKESVGYTQTSIDSEVELGNYNGNTTDEKNLNVIPNGNNFAINADVKLSNKTNSINLTFNFNQPIVSGKRYKLNFSVRRNGILIKFYANTQQLGVYSKTFDDEQQVTIKANNPNSLTNTNSTNTITAYLKYGEEIILPTNPKRTATTYFNPEDVMTFEGWYRQDTCAKSDKITGNIKLNVENFPELKTNDTIKIYAYFEPHFYYWDSPTPIRDGGAPVAIGTYYGDFLAKDPNFKKLPTGADFKKYAAAPKFFDKSYTDDSQQGYWFLKWSPESGRKGTMDYTAISNSECNKTYSKDLYKIENGAFPNGYNIDDYFFVPILGEYRKDHGDVYCTTVDPDNSYYWPSNFYANYYTIRSTTLAQSIYCYSDYIYLYEISSTTGQYQGRQVRSAGLIRYWPDSTYPGN